MPEDFASLPSSYCLANARLILPEGVREAAALEIRDGRIAQVGAEAGSGPGPVLDLEGAFVAPGFIDLHIHGGNGRDSMEAQAEAFDVICACHAAGGTTRLLLTTMTAPAGQIFATLREAENYLLAGQEGGAHLLGVHLEGPFLSPEKPGCHPVEHLVPPGPELVERLLDHRRVLKKVTIAPELPGALAAIARFETAGIRTSVGHTAAGEQVMEEAVQAGLRQATHLYNCMSTARRAGLSREAGALEICLGDPRILCEVIADGAHVRPALMRLALTAKGAGGLCLITDATAGAGLPPGTPYRLGDVEAVVGEAAGVLADGSALAGSTCRMIDGVGFLVRELDVPLPMAVRLASANPAHALGLDGSLGSLHAGKRADLTLFDDNFTILGTFVDGRCVYQPR